MHLRSVLDSYALENEITAGYEYQLDYAIRRLNDWNGSDMCSSQLTDDVVNRWLKSEQNDKGLSDRSRQNLRTSVLTIWRYASEKNLASPPNKIRKVKVKEKNPEAWDFHELHSVAKAASELPGFMPNRIARSEYFTALIWFCFETGMRRSDAFAFDIQWMRDCVVAFPQSKTNRIHSSKLTAETASQVAKISEDLKSHGQKNWRNPLEFPGSVSQLYYWLRQCRARAGVDPGEKNRSIQHLRRTGATAVEAHSPHTAWKYLGHVTGPALSRRSYIDARIACKPIMPARNRSSDN